MCGDPARACSSIENYTDWSHFPSAINKEPFTNLDLDSIEFSFMKNEPKYYEVLVNNSEVVLDVN